VFCYLSKNQKPEPISSLQGTTGAGRGSEVAGSEEEEEAEAEDAAVGGGAGRKNFKKEKPLFLADPDDDDGDATMRSDSLGGEEDRDMELSDSANVRAVVDVPEPRGESFVSSLFHQVEKDGQGATNSPKATGGGNFFADNDSR